MPRHVIISSRICLLYTSWSELDDAVCHGVDEFVVVAREEDIALETYQVVVELSLIHI